MGNTTGKIAAAVESVEGVLPVVATAVKSGLEGLPVSDDVAAAVKVAVEDEALARGVMNEVSKAEAEMGNTTGKNAAAVVSTLGLVGLEEASVAGEAPKSSEVSDQTSPATGEKINTKVHPNDAEASWTQWKGNAAMLKASNDAPRRLIVDTPEEASSIGVSWAGGFGRSVAALIDGSSA